MFVIKKLADGVERSGEPNIADPKEGCAGAVRHEPIEHFDLAVCDELLCNIGLGSVGKCFPQRLALGVQVSRDGRVGWSSMSKTGRTEYRLTTSFQSCRAGGGAFLFDGRRGLMPAAGANPCGSGAAKKPHSVLLDRA